MSFLDKAQTFFHRFRGNDAPDEESMYSRRHDGSLSGYHPNAGRPQPQPAGSASSDMPPYDAWGQQAYAPGMAAQPAPQPETPPQQPTGYQPLWPQNDRSAYSQTYQPQWQSPPANQPGSPFMGYQPAFQQSTFQQPAPQQASPQSAPNNISYMNGMVVGEDGRGYLHTIRVAQISGVPDCYRLMESMRNNETLVVNLDQVNDSTEISRCLDLLYGATYALQCRFNRVSEGSVYLLTPATIQVENVDPLRRQSEMEVDNRWPDPGSLAYRQRVATREQQRYGASDDGRYAEAYGGNRRRTEYTDFGGFPNAGRY